MRTPDRRSGPLYEEDIFLEVHPSDPTEVGQIRRVNDTFKAKDGAGVFDLRSGAGLSEADHEDLDTLVHRLSETYYFEVLRTSGKVSQTIAWTDSGKTVKVRETLLTRIAGKVSHIVDKQYDGIGSLVQTMTGTVTRTGGRVTSIAWVET